jgi:hypothetical protein
MKPSKNSHKRRTAILVLFVSFLTLFLPKEVFDPHIGIELDIFCKSLDAIGDDVAIPFVLSEVFVVCPGHFIFADTPLLLFAIKANAIRAPPVFSH